MHEELLNRSISLFDTYDKWNAFLDLADARIELKNFLYRKGKAEITQYFNTKDLKEGWSFTSWNNWDYQWYLTEFGKDSLCIWMYGNRIGLWCNGNLFDLTKVSTMLSNSKYSVLLSLLRNDETGTGDWKVIEYGNFVFSSPFDGKIGPDRLAWFVANHTAEYIKQLAEKVNRFRDPEMTKLLREINEHSKK